MKRSILTMLALIYCVGLGADGEIAAPTTNRAFLLGARLLGFPQAKTSDELSRVLTHDWKQKPRSDAQVFIRGVAHRSEPLQAWVSSGVPDREVVSLTYISALLGAPAGTLTVTFRCDAAAQVAGVSCALTEK